MPGPNPFPPSASPASHPIPALSLFPLNDSFIPKYIHLNQRVKIGRQTNAKTVPGERNGFFDSKVLSRQHAEVWEEDGKIFIKDVKSSNGTFINGERLSPEGVESQPFELKTDDVIEFGIDIVAEDNKTIAHRKVAARVTCVLTPEDALAASAPQSFTGQRRPPALNAPPNTAAAGLGSMGAPAGQRTGQTKNGLTIEHILSRLQSGLVQSRETGQELGRLGEQMSEISETLSGNNPGPQHNYQQPLPPVRSNTAPIPSSHPHQHPHQPSAEHQPVVPSQGPPITAPQHPIPNQDTLLTLQAQLAETQSTLAAHVEKIRILGELAKDHEIVKREVGTLRGMLSDSSSSVTSGGSVRGREEDDDDDARSVMTVTPDEQDDREEDDEEEGDMGHDEVEDEMDRQPQPRPRTPEPMHGFPSSVGAASPPRSTTAASVPSEPISPASASQPSTASQPALTPELSTHLATLAAQLETALAVSKTLQEQQSAAQNTIEALEGKVKVLEEMVVRVQSKVDAVEPTVEPTPAPSPAPTTADTTQFVSILQLEEVKTEWAQMRTQWTSLEGRVSQVEEGLNGVVTESREFREREQQGEKEREQKVREGEGGGGIGLVTPPSPRSVSADSLGKRNRRRRGSRSRSGGRGRKAVAEVFEGLSEKEEGEESSKKGLNGNAKENGVAHHHNGNGNGVRSDSPPSSTSTSTSTSISTSFDRSSHTSVSPSIREGKSMPGSATPLTSPTTPGLSKREFGQNRDQQQQVPMGSVTAAIGVLLLSVAAVVAYRVRE